MDSWTDGKESARFFANSIEAFRHCAENQLSGVNIVIERESPRPPIIIPVELDARSGRITTGFPVSVSRSSLNAASR